MTNVRHGRMSDAEKAEIERLALALKRPSPAEIARQMERHPATVAWYMIRHGLIDRKISYRRRDPTYRVDGIRHPYSEAQDRRLLELRRANKKYREIAAMLTAEFGIPRNAHSVQVRATMLAAYDGGEE
jgi:IS30 family transposase